MRFRIIYVPAGFILSDKVMHRLLSLFSLTAC